MTPSSDGFLSWGVKASLRDYVTGNGGTVSFAPPVTWADNRFRYPLDAVESRAGGTVVVKYSGEVLFRAHRGLMEIAVADPWVELGPDRAVLTVATLERDHRTIVAELVTAESESESQSESAETVMETRLSEHGALLFGGFYPVGTALDPIQFAAPR